MDTVKIFTGDLDDIEEEINEWAQTNRSRIVSAQTVLGPLEGTGAVMYFITTVVFAPPPPGD